MVDTDNTGLMIGLLVLIVLGLWTAASVGTTAATALRFP